MSSKNGEWRIESGPCPSRTRPFGHDSVMASQDYERCRFSITVSAEDLATVACLRALCDPNLKGCRSNIGWGGTGERAWKESGKQITLRFTDPHERDSFKQDARRILGDTFKIVSTSDLDPATRQRAIPRK